MTSVTRITKGLDLPISGCPEQVIADGPVAGQVALIGNDYIGMKPTMGVNQGDRVRLGQVLFTDKKTPGVQYTSPATGTVAAVNRGAKRKFLSVVIDIDHNAEAGEQETFEAFTDHNLAQLDRRQVRDQLIASGLWTSLRTRPYSKVPAPETIPDALFVTAMDTNPLAADPVVVLSQWHTEFTAGLQILSTLCDGFVHVCRRAGSDIPGEGKSPAQFHAFDGPHPAGLVGTHIHLLDPVNAERTVWHIGYQDVVAMGHLFLTGKILTERVVSLAGPPVTQPRLIRTRLGASLSDLTAGQCEGDETQLRVISGSVLTGQRGVAPIDFLGRYHQQVSVLSEGRQREFLGWMKLGKKKFSVRRVFASAFRAEHGRMPPMPLDTNTGGSPRAMVPIGMYEQVMPLDIIATPLLKALINCDTQYAQELGVLELDEEDLALCTFVCSGKYEYGPMLRSNLTQIENEG